MLASEKQLFVTMLWRDKLANAHSRLITGILPV